MQKDILFLLFFLLLFQTCVSQNNIDPKFVGMWTNSQYNLFKDSSNQSILYGVSPQFIKIDSSGNCTLYLRYEQRSIIGKPSAVKSFGSIQDVTYKKNYTFSLSLIKGEKDFIVLTFLNTPSSTVFIRQEKHR